jgi:hypothetical protein
LRRGHDFRKFPWILNVDNVLQRGAPLNLSETHSVMKIQTATIRKIKAVRCSVADPGCLFRIRNYSIPDPGSKSFPDPDPHERI